MKHMSMGPTRSLRLRAVVAYPAVSVALVVAVALALTPFGTASVMALTTPATPTETAAPTTAAPNPATPNGRVLAAFGVVNLPNSAVQLLARVDRLDPNTDVDNDASTRFIGGVAYRISPNVRVLADLDAVSYQAATLSAANQAQKTRLLFQSEFVF